MLKNVREKNRAGLVNLVAIVGRRFFTKYASLRGVDLDSNLNKFMFVEPNF